MNKLQQYLSDNLIDFKVESNSIVNINDLGLFLFIEPKNDIIILPSFELNLSEEEKNIDVDFYCFQFGENFYYTESNNDLTLKPLKYLNKYVNDFDLSIPFLGLHGGYELLNGSRSYNDWIQKAKFLNINTLAICEKNTLAGTLKFQMACKSNNIKSIIGEQVAVKDGENLFQFKCYVKNKEGWENLLAINKEITVTNHGFIDSSVFLRLVGGLFIVIDTKYSSYSKMLPYDLNISELFYQIDTVEFSNNEKDKEYLLNLKNFINQTKIKPLFISDAYYLDKEDFRVKKILNAVSNIRDYGSKNQYFKTVEENFALLSVLFDDENKCFDLFEKSIINLNDLAGRCDFEIETGVKYLPKYIMTEEEKKTHKTKDNMFWSLVQEGIDAKLPKEGDLQKYEERIIEEHEVIQLVISEAGDGIDYFLISWDIIRFCHENDILVGLSRGSSAGSLLAYLLNITKINPFDYDLLFSRFLNVGRVKKGALPDFDIDFQTLRRSEVKKYIEQKYGVDNVCSVGTYTTLQLRAALKDIARQRNVEFGTVNYISQALEVSSGDWEDIFKTAFAKKQVKDFILNYPDVVDDIQLILKQPKSNSIHACATIIVPDGRDIFQSFPVRLGEKDGETMVVSEWEGNELEAAGFLKEDILGVLQLDKYKFIIDLIKEITGEVIDIYSIPLKEEGVYELFKKGYNGDIFQLGTVGMTNYCKDMKPENIYELIDAISLYRPGAMDVNAHNEYVLRKFGEREVTFHWGTENILKHTYGLIIYQEQVMQIVQELADFDEVTSDDIRRCVYPDSLLWTNNGYEKIKNLSNKDNVLTYSDIEIKNKTNKVRKFFNSGSKRCIRLVFDGGREIICTEDHRFYTNKGWIEAQYLINNELYCLHELQEKYGNCDVSMDKLYLTIALITEGYFMKEVTFSNKDVDEINKFKKAYRNYFKKEVKYEYIDKNNVTALHLDIDIVEELELNKVKSVDQVLPDYFLQLNKEGWLFSLAKLIDFDGYVDKEGRVYYCSKSKKLIDQIHLMFECLGVKANIVTRYKEKYLCNYYEVYIGDSRDLPIVHEKLKKYSYKLQNFKGEINNGKNYTKYMIPFDIWNPIIEKLINNSGYKRNELIKVSGRYFNKNISIDKLSNILTIVGRSKLLEFFIKKNVFWEKVVDIQDYGVSEVYDFTMNSGCVPQAYVNGLLVHNSMGKKKKDVIDKYKEQFIFKVVEKGCPEAEAEIIWHELEVHSGYSFNKSHAASYAITGYIGQWFKYHYPLQFWTSAFQFDTPNPKKSNIGRFISEIHRTDNFIKIQPPDINESGEGFMSNPDKMEIYWSISKVKQVGEKALEVIIDERTNKGEFFSLEDFLSRIDKRVVNKAVVINLILSGSFDELENINHVGDRKILINKYYEFTGAKREKDDVYLINHENYWWQIKQKELSGFGDIDYITFLKDKTEFSPKKYISGFDLPETKEDSNVLIAGLIKRFVVRVTKKNDEFCRVTLDNNNEEIDIVIWNETYQGLNSESFEVGKILTLEGKVVKDNYKGGNVIHSFEKTKVIFI